MKVKLLTTEQKDLLVGVEIADNHFYNPFQDDNTNFVISLEECDQTSNPDFIWVKDLPEIDYIPIKFNLFGFNAN